MDLGLPSGTKWAKQYLGVTNISNEGDYFSYVKSQEYSIPTEIQLNELKDCCKFVTKDDRILLIGPNGNELVFLNSKVWVIAEDLAKDVDDVSDYRSSSNTGRSTFWLRNEKSLNEAIVGYVWPEYENNIEKECIHTRLANSQMYKHQIRLVKCSNPII